VKIQQSAFRLKAISSTNLKFNPYSILLNSGFQLTHIMQLRGGGFWGGMGGCKYLAQIETQKLQLF